jgi:hypothetical protein
VNLHSEGHLNLRAALVAASVTLLALLVIFLLSEPPPGYLRVVICLMGIAVVATGIAVSVMEIYLRHKAQVDQQRIRSEMLRRFGDE